ncbi:MAG: DUF1501 domain-containing protein [Planctomycetes bacterium]|nr:DUF1501 domain-containing protein [Planctomycetota bacterium]
MACSHDSCRTTDLPLTRRSWLARVAAAGGATWLAPSLADLFVQSASAQGDGGRTGANKHLILLWLAGGPSQFETFDPKPGTPTGGGINIRPTATAGWTFSQWLPNLAARAEQMAVIRSFRSSEGSHARASDLAHFGYTPTPAIAFPTIGAIVAHQLGDGDHPLPPFVQVDGLVSSSGYLGVDVAPFFVRDPGKKIDNLNYRRGVDAPRLDRREQLRQVLEQGFVGRGGGDAARRHDTQRQRARRLMDTELISAFDLATEPDAVHDAYGRGRFGQGVLLARRLVERGVAAVEVTLRGWDTHVDNLPTTRNLCGELDPALSALIDDLAQRDLLDDTLVVAMGEFGRTPTTNASGGRDHWPQNGCVVLAGGGLRGGQAIGATDATGEALVTPPTSIADLFATVAALLGVQGDKDLTPPGTRPTSLVDPLGRPLRELLRNS